MTIDKIKKWIEDFRSKPVKSQVVIVLPYLIVITLTTRFIELYRLCNGNLTSFIQNMAYIYKTIPRFIFQDLLIGIPVGFVIVWLFKWYNKLHGKNERLGEEYGSAR